MVIRKSVCISVLIGLLSFSSCREEEIIIIEQVLPPAQEQEKLKVDLSGYVQKGPFINGTTVVVIELDDSLAATGKTFTTQITDNRGSFFIKTSQLEYTHLQLIATGFYYDEVRGEKSAAQLTLYALADVSADASINVNILSHLEKDRVLYLISQGKNFSEAKAQAQAEILAAFGIVKENMQPSELLDISQAGEDNAILLAISAILQGDNSVGELSELLAEISTDLREDGIVNNEKIKSTLVRNAIHLDLPAVRQHLERRYEELGVDAKISNFEQYIDSDGDGILNKEDDNMPDEFIFAAVENAQRNTTYLSELITISGLPYPTIAKVSKGKLIKNGEDVGQDTIYVSNGDQLQISLTSPLNWEEKVATELQLGDYKTEFTVINQAYPWATAVSGYLQVGPFSNGASFTLTEIDSNFVKTTTSFATQTTNGQGYYSKNDIQLSYPWARAEARGYYYDFINKKMSEGELTLTAYTDLSTTTKLNVNVLTHLEAPRVKYLVNSGLTFAEAKQQALREVLAVFEIDEPISTFSEHFDIAQNNREGAILLAVSAILQGYESTGTLQELLRNISEDLEADGTLNNSALGSALINNAFYLDLTAIRMAVYNKYKELGMNMTVADFEKYTKDFKSNTNFVLTRRIEYPSTGIYGENILGNTKKFPKESRLGVYAILPTHSKLTLKISSVDNDIAWGVGVEEGWSTVKFDAIAQSISLRANTIGEVKFSITVFDDIRIDIFENDSTTPTRTISIDAY